MNPRRTAVAPVLVMAGALLLGGWFLQKGVGQEQSLYFQARLFQEVVDHVAERYVDPVDRGTLYQTAIEGVLEHLGDPNTSFLDARNWENFRIRTEGEYGGVGLEIVERDGWVTVVSPIPGTPGFRAGIRAGDRIVEVEGESAEGWSSDRAADRLRGRPGSEVSLKVARPGIDEPIPFTVTREVIQLRSVPFSTLLEDGVGYIPLRVFSEHAESEVRSAIAELKSRGMTRLVMDLRGNTGGLLDQGVAVADLFLRAGLPVVETRGRAADQNGVLRTSRPEAYPDLPLVLLIDESSASASEIVAGALQDHDRALVLGSTSFGKGSVQTLFRLTGGNVLRLTTARWYTPAGRSIQKDFDAQLSVAERGVPTLAGALAERPDTAGKARVTSMGGRSLVAGGGITPDLLILPDTLTLAEQQAVRVLYQRGGAFNNAMFNFSVRYLQENPELPPAFSLPDAELDRFHDFLKESGIVVDRSAYDAASRYVRFRLEQNIARRSGGDEGEFRQSVARDPVVKRAVELLRNADSPGALFRLAGVGSPVEAEGEGGGSEGSDDRVEARAPLGGILPGEAPPRNRHGVRLGGG